MPSDEYKVAFSPERYGDEEKAPKMQDGYFTQYYDHAPTRAAATVLTLTAPSLTTGINAKLRSEHTLGDTVQSPIGGPPHGPRVRPNTVILRRGVKIGRSSATFKFTAKRFGSWFMCRIDHHHYTRCTSPVTYRHLKPGRHLFEVRAVSKTGAVDPTPARFGKFKIGLGPRGR